MQNFIKRRVCFKTTKWLQGMVSFRSFRPGWLYSIIMGQTWLSIVCFYWSIFEHVYDVYHNYELYKLHIIICIYNMY